MSNTTSLLDNLMVDGMYRGLIGAWAASTAYAVGQMIYGTNSTAYGKVMRCTVAGTTGATQPATWPAASYTGAAVTQTDGGVTWEVWNVGMFEPPLWVALLTTTNGPRANSTAYSLNNTISLTANDGKTHLYKCTTAGTTAASQGTLYPGANNEAITDGTAVFTEQYAGLKAGTAQVEASYTGYARVGITPNATNMAATNAAASTANPSTGTNGTSSNNAAVTFGAPTSGPSFVWGFALYSSNSSGSMLWWAGLTTVKTINNGDAAPSFAISAMTLQVDN